MPGTTTGPPAKALSWKAAAPAITTTGMNQIRRINSTLVWPAGSSAGDEMDAKANNSAVKREYYPWLFNDDLNTFGVKEDKY